jgi:hypothetical protein
MDLEICQHPEIRVTAVYWLICMRTHEHRSMSYVLGGNQFILKFLGKDSLQELTTNLEMAHICSKPKTGKTPKSCGYWCCTYLPRIPRTLKDGS